MLQPQAKFPPEVSSDYLQGTGCSSKVDCTCCFSGKEFAMIDGQRFYLSFNSLEKLAPVVRKQLPSAWSELGDAARSPRCAPCSRGPLGRSAAR